MSIFLISFLLSVNVLASIVCIPVDNGNAAVGLKICVVTAEITKY